MGAPSNTAYIQGQGQVSADGLNTFVQTANTADDLRDFTGLPGISVNLLGIESVNDGSGGLFFWAAGSTAADDNLNVIAPTAASSGRWLREGVLLTTLPVEVAEVVVDGGGATPSTGIVGDSVIPVDCTLVQWFLQADAEGDVVIDVWVKPFSAPEADSTPPTIANTITGSIPPQLSSQQGKRSLILTGWTTAIPANSWVRYNLVSISGITRFTLTLLATVP